MGSPITLSGFNDIDFNLILNAVMEQERIPVLILEQQQSSLNSQSGAFGNLATRLASLETAVGDLDDASAFGQRTATNTDTTALSVTPTDSTPVGTYDIIVNELARAAVLATDSSHADKDTTVVASGGSLTIGGTVVNVTGDVTLEGLRDAINSTSDVGVTASIVTPTAGTYQLVVTGNDTGASNAYTIVNALTGGAAPVTFDDFDSDGTSGDDASDYKVEATDALATVNNIAVSSSTNVLEDAIPGASVTLIKKDPLTTITVGINQDTEATKTLVTTFIDSYNSLVDYFDSEIQSAAAGNSGSIGRDGLLRSLRTTLTSTLASQYAVGGSFETLAEVGIGFEQDGRLSFDATAYDDAIESGTTDVEKLFVGSGGTDGVFTVLASTVKSYTESGGLIPDAQARLDTQVSALATRIAGYEERLSLRRLALQQEYAAADQAMQQLNNQAGPLSQLGSQYRLF